MGILLMSATLDAQYFGRNKVQYEDFDFKVLKTDHFDIYYYPLEAEAARMAARMAERWYARLSRTLDYEMGTRQPLILYASHPHFRQTNAVSGGIGEGTGGVTESFKRRIVLPFGASLEATNHVIGHELVHAFQFAMTGADVQRASLTGMPSALGLPLWFIEGMAEYLSLGPVDPHTAMWMREAAAREDLPTVDELDSPEYFPYRYGHAFWAYVAGRWGDGVVRTLLLAAADPRGRMDAMANVLGVDTEPGNPVNSNALVVVTPDGGARLGWVPDGLVHYIGRLLDSTTLTLRVVRVNGPAQPDQLRLLVAAEGRLPEGSPALPQLLVGVR
jgi:hypothetical protein